MVDPIQHLRRDGYAILPSLLDAAAIERCHNAIAGCDVLPVDGEIVVSLASHPTISALLDSLCETRTLNTRGGAVRRSPLRWHIDPLWWCSAGEVIIDRSVSLTLLWSLGQFDERNGAVELYGWNCELVTTTMPPGSCLALFASHVVHRSGDAFDAEARPTVRLDIGAVLREPLPSMAVMTRDAMLAEIAERKK